MTRSKVLVGAFPTTNVCNLLTSTLLGNAVSQNRSSKRPKRDQARPKTNPYISLEAAEGEEEEDEEEENEEARLDDDDLISRRNRPLIPCDKLR